MKCAKCFAENHASATECTLCGVQFADLNRERGLKSAVKSMKYCAWNDRGTTCDFRGIVSHGTNGDGAPFYCREHWQKLNDWPDLGIVGNGLPPAVQSHGAREYHQRSGNTRSRVITDMPPVTTWLEAETYNAMKVRVREKVATSPAARQREPGDDDEEVEETW